MLQFRFTKGEVNVDPFALEVDVERTLEPSALTGSEVIATKLVGNLACVKVSDNLFEVYDLMPGSEDEPPVHTLNSVEEFPAYVMFEIPESAWRGVH